LADDNIKIEKNSVTVSVNPLIYPIEAIYSASYVFLENAYVMLDGDPKKKIQVTLRPKEPLDIDQIERLGRSFANELINFADYSERAKSSKSFREMILQRALFTNDPEAFRQKEEDISDDEVKALMEELEEDGTMDDPEEIAKSWEEKYGVENNEKKD
jgi:His-Xaa-Ser system protein HxsD